MDQSQLPNYDFPLIVNYGRLTQLITLVLQTYVIYSEWDRIGSELFFPLLIMFAIHGANTFVRWRDSIDGRFDIKQMITTSNNQLRVQYAMAVFVAPVLSLITWSFFYPEGMSILNSTVYWLSTIAKTFAACGVLFLEIFEVSKEKMKK